MGGDAEALDGRSMSYDRVERALVQHALDVADAELAQARAEMAARVTALKESWSSGFEQQLADSEARQQAIRDQTQQYLQSIYADDDGTHALAAGGHGADVSGLTAAPDGHDHRQQPDPDPYAAELAEAERIRTMPMQDWAEVRRTLIRTSDSLFG